jgi:hypothetical protein
MRSRPLTLLAAALLAAAVNRASAITFTTLNFPGASYTSLQGIDGDRIVGSYQDDLGQHGFLREGAAWLQLDVPFPAKNNTHIYGISGNRMVGEYYPGPQPFVFEGGFGGGLWTPLDEPFGGAAQGVDGAQIVGRTDRGAFHYDGVTWTILAYPGSAFTSPLDVQGSRIVGFYQNGDFTTPRHGFVYESGAWQTLDYPGSVQTEIHAIDNGRLVGTWSDDLQSHGFIYDGTTWQSFDYPDSIGTIAHDISGNRIVGTYFDLTGNSHTFLATIPEPAALPLALAAAALQGCRRVRPLPATRLHQPKA